MFLVNARHVKNVPGRKTDVEDCQWLQYLHTVGLSFGPSFPARAGLSATSVPYFCATATVSGADGLGSHPTHAKSLWTR